MTYRSEVNKETCNGMYMYGMVNGKRGSFGNLVDGSPFISTLYSRSVESTSRSGGARSRGSGMLNVSGMSGARMERDTQTL